MWTAFRCGRTRWNASGRLAYLPDDPQLYDYMTGIQYLDFIADIFGVSTAQRAQRIRQYGDAFGLTQDLAQSIGHTPTA